MATPVLEKGTTYGCSWTPSGGSSVAFNCKVHDKSLEVDLADVTNSGHAGVQALLATIMRGEFNMTLTYDSANDLFASSGANVRPGVNGVLIHTIGSSKTFTLPVIISKINSTVPVGQDVEINVNARLNALAGNSGAITWPT